VLETHQSQASMSIYIHIYNQKLNIAASTLRNGNTKRLLWKKSHAIRRQHWLQCYHCLINTFYSQTYF